MYKDDAFLVKGTWYMGIAGTYENKEFNEENITLEYGLSSILDDLEEDDDFFWGPIFPLLKESKKDGDSIASVLTDYYNKKEEEIKKNIKQINSCIWINMFRNMVDCEYPFWETKEAITDEMREKYSDEAIKQIYSSVSDSIYKMYDEYYNSPNNGTIEKTDVEAELRKLFPMFNFDGLIKSIKSEGLVLSGRFIQFQFSDTWGCDFLCSAYDSYDENFASTDWHNF